MKNNVISIADYRKQKEVEELDDLAERVMTAIRDLDIDPSEAQQSVFITPLTGYDDIGLASVSNVQLNPTRESCCSTLGWVSYVLGGLGEHEAANDLDNIIARLEAKVYKGEVDK